MPPMIAIGLPVPSGGVSSIQSAGMRNGPLRLNFGSSVIVH
jgi:hypothetical protein